MNSPYFAPQQIASELNLQSHWMPFTANRHFQQDPRLVVKAEGNWLYDQDGRQIFDSLSGLWTCGAGHARRPGAPSRNGLLQRDEGRGAQLRAKVRYTTSTPRAGTKVT